MTSLKALSDLARSATSGPWSAHDGHGAYVASHAEPNLDPVCVCDLSPGSSLPEWEGRIEDAKYIAAASPDVVLKLIAVAEAAKAWAESDECDKFLPNKRREQGILDALEDLEK